MVRVTNIKLDNGTCLHVGQLGTGALMQFIGELAQVATADEVLAKKHYKSVQILKKAKKEPVN